jgi:hypothetical protein
MSGCLSCENTATCETQDYGVTNDGQGQLSGYAWSEDAGWISFGGATFALKTAWTCSPAPPVPGEPIALVLQKSGTDTLLSWPAIPGATAYDLIRGSLGLLRSTGGDFSAATDVCLESKDPATVHADEDVPAAGESYWYLARGASCGGAGSYDSAGPGQVGSRDAEVDISPGSCP